MTEKENHTPGPWRIGEHDSIICDTPKNGRPQSVVTKKIYGGYVIAEVCAPENLHLIAAAPELYEAGKAVLYLLKKQRLEGGLYLQLRYAIDRAEKGKDA